MKSIAAIQSKIKSLHSRLRLEPSSIRSKYRSQPMKIAARHTQRLCISQKSIGNKRPRIGRNDWALDGRFRSLPRRRRTKGARDSAQCRSCRLRVAWPRAALPPPPIRSHRSRATVGRHANRVKVNLVFHPRGSLGASLAAFVPGRDLCPRRGEESAASHTRPLIAPRQKSAFSKSAAGESPGGGLRKPRPACWIFVGDRRNSSSSTLGKIVLLARGISPRCLPGVRGDESQ